MKAIKRLTVAGGKYTYNGETKTRWVDVGTLFQREDGTYSILLNAGINFAAFVDKQSQDPTAVWVNLFDLRDKESKPKLAPQPKQVIVDDVPF